MSDASRRRATPSRRELLTAAGWALTALPIARLMKATPIVTEPWASVSRLADGVWAITSTPFEEGDYTTVANGGIVAGDERVLVVEAFAGESGAKWAIELAERLCGRRPTDLVVTHYHGDHTRGLSAFAGFEPAIRLHGTAETLGRIRGKESDDRPEAIGRRALIDAAEVLAGRGRAEIDLGGIVAVLHGRTGHTASDVTVELPELGIGFAGDLVWNRMIPNFVDARPKQLAKTLRDLRDQNLSTWVPGHGPLGDENTLALNIELSDRLEATARATLDEGLSARGAAERLDLKGGLDEWVSFSPDYLERALAAWHRELEAPAL